MRMVCAVCAWHDIGSRLPPRSVLFMSSVCSTQIREVLLYCFCRCWCCCFFFLLVLSVFVVFVPFSLLFTTIWSVLFHFRFSCSKVYLFFCVQHMYCYKNGSGGAVAAARERFVVNCGRHCRIMSHTRTITLHNDTTHRWWREWAKAYCKRISEWLPHAISFSRSFVYSPLNCVLMRRRLRCRCRNV